MSLLSSSGLLWSEEFISEHFFFEKLNFEIFDKMGLDIEAAFNKADTDHSGFIGEYFLFCFDNDLNYDFTYDMRPL